MALKNYSELSKGELYEILKLRMEVFILEQKSLYLDLDGVDKEALHFMGLQQQQLVAYLRVNVPQSSSIAYIRRVVVDPNFRQQGLGNILMQNALKYINSLEQISCIELDAQCYLQSFYRKFGFEAVGDIYDDGGILHINMRMMGDKKGIKRW